MKKISDLEYSNLINDIYNQNWYYNTLYQSNRYYKKEKKVIISPHNRIPNKMLLQNKINNNDGKNKLLNFYEDIYDFYKICFIMHVESFTTPLIFQDKDEFFDIVNLSLNQQFLISILIPDVSVIISTWYGNSILYFHTNPELKKEMDNLIKNHELYMYDKKYMQKFRSEF